MKSCAQKCLWRLGWLASLLLLAVPLTAARAERVRFLDKEFVCYWVDLRTDQLSLHWRDQAGKPLATFTRLREHLRPREVKFAINGGIFSRDLTPLGLHVQEGRELVPLNAKILEGGQFNFYLKPNGVFFIGPDGPAVVSTERYAELKPQARLACQSGPLLLTNGVIHHAFRPASTNFHWRTGVGVNREGQVVFALSLQALRFHDFARLFKEKLACDDALYLDGDICAVYLPELGHHADSRSQFAAMMAVTVPARGAPGAAAAP